MLNHYPLWKYILIALVIMVAAFYALPNLYGEDPALQVAGSARGVEVDDKTLSRISKKFEGEGVQYRSAKLSSTGLLFRFKTEEDREKAKKIAETELGDDYAVALNRATATPQWLLDMNAQPMYLGLDLRGGIYFLMQVDMEAAVLKSVNTYVSDSRTILRKAKTRYLGSKRVDNDVVIRFKTAELRDKGLEILKREMRDISFNEKEDGKTFMLQGRLSEAKLKELKLFALKQNITTLRKRIDEKFHGLVEPIIQQQGEDRIVIQLPGIQDTAGAKDILGATATLEYRAVDEEHTVEQALSGRVPAGSRIYYTRERKEGSRTIPSVPVLLKKRVIVTGEHVTNAQAGIDPDSGGAKVNVSLDGYGGKRMGAFTKENVGKRMAVVYLETKQTTVLDDKGNTLKDEKGNTVFKRHTTEEVISNAVIRGHFSNRFETTGLDSVQEANELSLLLRAGALAAPVYIIEERTIGPSLGQDSIDRGFRSVIIGFVAVLFFMAFWYRKFGMIANLALGLNLVIIVAVLSLLQATLTLPGIAGIVLTVGMAVDANVLIFERIREELRNGNSPQNSIHSGYEKALMTIADANITTLIAAFVLFVVGTGAIKGFAVTLSIGIVTSMFTAIMVSRAVVNLIYGGKRIKDITI
ncbi:MAG: protein translocase subunit SecD [Gammaproteobacteria bacterium]|nr:protein translocase subunit SecD [Gammaproteobacteria bacterium]